MTNLNKKTKTIIKQIFAKLNLTNITVKDWKSTPDHCGNYKFLITFENTNGVDKNNIPEMQKALSNDRENFQKLTTELDKRNVIYLVSGAQIFVNVI